jgi:hypothetical protein
MAMKKRVLKYSRVGKLSRAGVKKALSFIHVYPSKGSGWEVKEIGISGLHRRFASEGSAAVFARRVAQNSDGKVVVHKKRPTLKIASHKDVVYKLVRE